MRRTLRALLFAAASTSALCGAPLRAQQPPAEPPPAKDELAQEPSKEGSSDVPQPADIEALRQHYRPTLHPGDPLRIGGNEQDGNQLRVNTPLLARGEHTPLQVDIEASYQRALAMYGDGAQFHSPLPPAQKGEPAARLRSPRETAPEPAPKMRGPEATPWSVLAGVSVSVLLLVWFFVRVRPALIAPQEAHAPADTESEAFVFRPTRRASAPVFAPLAEPPAPLPQRPSGVGNGARMVRQPKQR